jgi:hypothetical protein
MSILYVEIPIPLKDIQSWVYKDGHRYATSTALFHIGPCVTEPLL